MSQIKRCYRYALVVLLCVCLSYMASATHNRAGEITYVQTGDLTIVATITTYTKASSTQADRDSLTINWGDGTESRLPRINGNGEGEILPGDIKFNIYVGEHTYPGRSTYTLSMQDPNRIGNILNINNSNSITIPFYIETTITFFNPQFQGYNSSAILQQSPIDQACVGRRFIHNPNAYDPDRDSLSFELVSPLEGVMDPVPMYVLPNVILPGSNNQIFFNERTGEFVWESPQRTGEYNIAIRINEFRNGQLITSIVRDMQINVVECDNRPPIITASDRICVVAEEVIDEEVILNDPDLQDIVRLSASGGPLSLPISPAVFQSPDFFNETPVQGRFIWNTDCTHIADPDYSVVFKGEDDEFVTDSDTTGLVDLHTLLIHVSGPPPQDLSAETSGGQVILSWEEPYSCQDAADNYFKGFTIWRSRLPINLKIDTCGMNLEEEGYQAIKFQENTVMDGRFVFTDDDVEKGITYCYRVTAEFALTSPGGNPFNRVQSLPSNEICIQVNRDIPLITHVTVDETDVSSGAITVRWVAPLADDLDTMENPPPYRYRLLRSEGIDTDNFSPVPGADFTTTSFGALQAIDSFVDQNINTLDLGYTYSMEFYAGDVNNIYGQSQSASSVFLSAIASDRRVDLNWTYQVPWFVFNHEIFRQNSDQTSFVFLDSTELLTYLDIPVQNDSLYCYYIQSIGAYGLSDIEDPLINRSQILCVTPVDSVPPCQPQLTLSNNCDDLEAGSTELTLINELRWHFDDSECFDSTDVAQTQIFFLPNDGSEAVLLEITDADTRAYIHEVAPSDIGCYFIIAVDVSDNESLASDTLCPSICPLYELPNAFTPNDDGSNDLFTAYPYRFIERVNMKIYSRWGELIFETEDPDINWDGTDFNGGDVSEDLYYYECQTYLTNGEKYHTLTGNITLIRN